jgi:hypothetical protein
MTALALGEAGAPIAVMPMGCRDSQAAPGRPLKVGWVSSNQFASRMGLRRQTRDSAPEWPQLLPELDLLLVVRREETSLAGRWYQQTGFEEVLAIRCLYLDMEAPPLPASRPASSASASAGQGRYLVQVATPVGDPAWLPQAAHWQTQMLSVYQEVYSAFGGARRRSADFWSPALKNHFYRDHYQFQILGLWSSSPTAQSPASDTSPETPHLMGYAVVGWSGWHSKRPRMDILELATRQWDTGIAADLIQATCQLAWSKNVRQVRAVVSAHDPYRGHLTRTGFEDRWGYQMSARWLNPQRYLDRLARALPPELGDLQIELCVPGQLPLVLRRASHQEGAPHHLRLQGSSRTITRLLLNRLDVAAALQEGSLAFLPSSTSGDRPPESDITRLSLAFPWTPWAFHMLDYI